MIADAHLRKMSSANSTWGSPRIVGELAKLGINVAKATVERYSRTAHRTSESPWQNPFAERVIGSVRRECLDQVIVLNEGHLQRLLGDFFQRYHRWRCHRSLAMDCPAPRPVQGPEHGVVVEVAEASGLYRHYERRAA